MVASHTDSTRPAFTVSVMPDVWRTGQHRHPPLRSRPQRSRWQSSPQPTPGSAPVRAHLSLRAREGGVLKRAGHYEAARGISPLSRLLSSRVISRSERGGSMARPPQLASSPSGNGLRLLSMLC